MDFSAGRVPAYGSSEQPAIADRMTPYLKLTYVGAAAAALAVVAAVIGLVGFPSFASSGTGEGWAVALLVAAVVMLAICLGQVVLWRRAYAAWRGRVTTDLRSESRLSWVLHLLSYAAVLVALLSGIAASAATGFTTAPAVELTLAMALVVLAQVLAGVQFVRPDGPPGTIPAHLRRLASWTAQQRKADDE